MIAVRKVCGQSFANLNRDRKYVKNVKGSFLAMQKSKLERLSLEAIISSTTAAVDTFVVVVTSSASLLVVRATSPESDDDVSCRSLSNA